MAGRRLSYVYELSTSGSLSSPAAHTPLVCDFGGFHPRYWVAAATRPDHLVHTAIDGYMMGFSKRSFQTIDR